MTRERLSAELERRSVALSWLVRLETLFTRGLGGRDAGGWWEPDSGHGYPRAQRLTSRQITERLNIPAKELWRYLAPAGLKPRVLRFDGTATRGLDRGEVEATRRRFEAEPLTRVSHWFGDGFNEETGEWAIPPNFREYAATIRGWDIEDGQPSFDALREEWRELSRRL